MTYTFNFQQTPTVVMPTHNGVLSHPPQPPPAQLQSHSNLVSSIPPLASPPPPPPGPISHNPLSPLHLASPTNLTSPASSHMSTDSGSYMGGGVPLELQSPTPITPDPSLLAPMSPPGIPNVPNGGSFPSSSYSHHHHPSVNSIFSQQQQQHGHQVIQNSAHSLTQADMSQLMNDHAQGMQPRPPPMLSHAPMVTAE